MEDRFTVHTSQCRLDLGMVFMAELCERLRNWLLKKEKFRVTVEYDPDGNTNVEITALGDIGTCTLRQEKD